LIANDDDDDDDDDDDNNNNNNNNNNRIAMQLNRQENIHKRNIKYLSEMWDPKLISKSLLNTRKLSPFLFTVFRFPTQE